MGVVHTFVLIFAACITTAVRADNPGFKARITQKGLDYANKVAVDGLVKSAANLKIPDESGESGKLKYSVTGVHISKFTPPASAITLTPGQGLAMKATDAEIAVAGKFSYKALFIDGHGSFTASVTGASFSLGLDIGTDHNGRPTIAANGCTESISDVDIKFSGGSAWILNLIKTVVESKIKDFLKDQLCQLIEHEINVDGESQLAVLPVTTILAKKFLLDYRLTKTPLFNTGYMETYHKGDITWADGPSAGSPLTPPPFGDPADADSMMFLYVSDYMFDTMGQAAQDHGFLVYNLTTKDLPASSRGVLNTSCDGFIPKCVGKLIPQIGEKYPNRQVELCMASTSAPTMKITPDGIQIQSVGTIGMYVQSPSTQDTPFLVSFDATMTSSVKVTMNNEMLYAKVDQLSLNLKTKKSAIGPIQDTFIDFLIKEALNMYLIPQLNDLGQKGFPLPMTGQIKFVNTKLSYIQDALVISTDLLYNTKDQKSDIDDMTGPLKFKPFHHDLYN